ncbi:class I SAM-dependent methyltransferase [Niveibacterium umoris]|uniref:SAM-dependent methyltransferase n=2 Tax=Niveibacterium umoris TaxID=1193620 RepID=A0A840BMS5_9RHOO|nr:class I SAM-dependent methyltransferase [Niveibacterium umoris]MBB4012819.1 SAM-dependent methyltransferase [Niveibacterium umoris]
MPSVEGAAEPPTATGPLEPERTVARDGALSGWFNHETGELLPGYDASGDDVVLDVGCGDTPLSSFFANRAGSMIVADLLAENVEKAESRLRAVGARNVRAIVTDTDPLPLDSASVTRVVATEVLEHVPDPTRFMAELVRVGRPGARYLLSVPDASSEALQQTIAAPSYFEPPNHVRVFSREAFERLVVDAGLVIEHRKLYGFYWTMWWCFFWTCKQDLSPPWHPLLESWTRTWGLLLDTEQGGQIKAVLDNALPKSQLIVARKP